MKRSVAQWKSSGLRNQQSGVRISPDRPLVITLMIYFKKLDFTLPKIDMSQIIGGALLEGYGESFRSWNISNLDYFNNLTLPIIKFNIPPKVVNYTEITGVGAGPHTDEVSVSLNYYIEAENCVTIIWKLKDPNLKIKTLPQLTNTNDWIESKIGAFDISDITKVAHFNAKSSEAWLLNTHSIHSVLKPNPFSTRKFIRWMWTDYSLEEIYNSIEIL